MAELVLQLLSALIPFIHHFTLGEYDLAVVSKACFPNFAIDLIVKLPQLDDSVIGGEHLQGTTLIVEKLDRVYFLIQLNGLQVVKFRLVALDLGKVSVVEVTRVLQVQVLEDNNSSALIAHCEIVSTLVERYRGKHVVLRHILLVSLS